VLVWPPHLVPISGDACVEPTDVLRDLGPAVERACGAARPEPGSADVRALPRRASRRRAASHPSLGTAEVVPGPGLPRRRTPEETEAIVVDREPAPVLILPVTPVVEPDPQP
jgi:hypothetical protein